MLPARKRSAAFWMTMILALGAGAGRAAVIAVDGTTIRSSSRAALRVKRRAILRQSAAGRNGR